MVPLIYDYLFKSWHDFSYRELTQQHNSFTSKLLIKTKRSESFLPNYRSEPEYLFARNFHVYSTIEEPARNTARNKEYEKKQMKIRFCKNNSGRLNEQNQLARSLTENSARSEDYEKLRIKISASEDNSGAI
ncbi:hypothetical protein [Candidatus Sororendozoicomonas aggregata]|uniref:hypothetical protein n=1 Tax=Candidatus Sororendozoicomonas aggregata TaxID=3073239 RepID=UPI002ED3D246